PLTMAAAWLAGIDRAVLWAVKRATLVTITRDRMPTIRAIRLMVRTMGRASRSCTLFIGAPVGGVCTVQRQKKRKNFTGRPQHPRYRRPVPARDYISKTGRTSTVPTCAHGIVAAN